MLAALLPTRAMPLSSNPIEIPGCGDLLVEQHEQIHLPARPRLERKNLLRTGEGGLGETSATQREL